MANDDEFEDLQANARASAAPKVEDDGRFGGLDALQTNEGTLILGSPADVQRARLMNRLSKTVDRSRKYDLPAFLPGVAPLAGEPEDE